MGMTEMKVHKRDGATETVCFDKILRRIRRECDASPQRGLSALPNVDCASLAKDVIGHLYDGMTTAELDDYTCSLAVDMSVDEPQYGELASRVAVSNLHKKTPPDIRSYLDAVEGALGSEVLLVFSSNMERLGGAVDHNRDYMYDSFGLSTLSSGYMLRDAAGGIVERPQFMLMRVAVGIHMWDIDSVIESYDLMSRGMFTHASPTIFNAGTKIPQMSSCFLMPVASDSLDGIMSTLRDCANISKLAGGIGVSCANIRAPGSVIRGTNGRSNGIVPILKIFNHTSRAFDQEGKRKGSYAMYLEPWHPDIHAFVELRRNHGDEDHRARDLFTALWVPDLFMRRVAAGGTWSLFCPDECRGLQDAHGPEFDSLYESYERAGVARKVVGAMDLWKHIVRCQIETGTPYLCFKDSCNSKSNHSHLGTIKCSNLCAEIIQFSSPEETAVCNLASVCLPKFVRPDGGFDFDGLIRVCGVVTRNLDRVITNSYHPVKQAEVSNLKHRPIGVGVQGLADTFALMKMPFESKEAADLNAAIFQAVYFGCVKASADLAESLGAHESFPGSPASRGLLQFDLWGHTPGPVDGAPLDWGGLKARIAKSGLRNSLLVALMPTASTSHIMGNNESFEPFTHLLSVRKTLMGESKVFNKHLIRDLAQAGLWSAAIKEKIIFHRDSVQHIPEIPADIRERYKTVWEIKQRAVIDMQAARGPFVCQSASNNLYVADPSVEKVGNMLFYAWTKGLKTGMYYLRVSPKTEAVKFCRRGDEDGACVSCSA